MGLGVAHACSMASMRLISSAQRPSSPPSAAASRRASSLGRNESSIAPGQRRTAACGPTCGAVVRGTYITPEAGTRTAYALYWPVGASCLGPLVRAARRRPARTVWWPRGFVRVSLRPDAASILEHTLQRGVECGGVEGGGAQDRRDAQGEEAHPSAVKDADRAANSPNTAPLVNTRR